MRSPSQPDRSQEVRFCRADDGVRLAWARHGSGPPLVIAACWLSHLQHDWQSPVWRHFLDDLGQIATVYRYDERGFGLSDWDVTDFSIERRLKDLETVVDAAGVDRFVMMGMSGPAPVAFAYAAKHPDRVTRFIAYGASAGGALGGDDPDADAAYNALIRAGWARPDHVFRRVFTTEFIPGATEEQMSWMDELMRTSTCTDNALASRTARRETDVSHLLPEIKAPTLVVVARDDRTMRPGEGAEMAAAIPDARLVVVESENHILLADEPSWEVFISEISDFIDEGRVMAPLTALSEREREILLLAAEGLDNADIGERLTLSVRTVERHFQNVYLKLGLSGRTARAAAVGRILA